MFYQALLSHNLKSLLRIFFYQPFLNNFLSAHIPITSDGIGGVEYLMYGIDKLIDLIDEIVVKHSAWDIVQQTRGGIGPRLQEKS